MSMQRVQVTSPHMRHSHAWLSTLMMRSSTVRVLTVAQAWFSSGSSPKSKPELAHLTLPPASKLTGAVSDPVELCWNRFGWLIRYKIGSKSVACDLNVRIDV
ncbi:hypothetical protein KC325_g103 [Hortaea werneckii]|nr:hypothetical protein KC325_g103 [Hortaea werneckii]